MNKISVAIVDDDDFARSELETLLRRNELIEFDLKGSFNSSAQALSFLQEVSVQLLFLDVRMPGLDGFELLDALKNPNFEVIFITSYNEYAIRAIRYSAMDYLLKPLAESDLHDALSRFLTRNEKNLTPQRLSNLRHNMTAQNENQFQLIIPTKQGDQQFSPTEIIRCEADSNYTMIHYMPNKKFLASKTLGDIENMLTNGNQFLRIHKSHLINTDFVLNVTANDEVLMKDQSRIPISRRRLSEVKSLLRNNR